MANIYQYRNLDIFTTGRTVRVGYIFQDGEIKREFWLMEHEIPQSVSDLDQYAQSIVDKFWRSLENVIPDSTTTEGKRVDRSGDRDFSRASGRYST